MLPLNTPVRVNYKSRRCRGHVTGYTYRGDLIVKIFKRIWLTVPPRQVEPLYFIPDAPKPRS